MKTFLVSILVLCSALYGCGSQLQQSNSLEGDENVTIISTELQQKIDQSAKKWNTITENSEFDEFYSLSNSLVIELSQVINSVINKDDQYIEYERIKFSVSEGLEDFERQLKKKLPFIGMTRIVEGTEIFFYLDKSVLLEKAKSIDCKTAENFLLLSRKIYGNQLTHEVGFPNWIDKKTDIQGISKLGEMIHYNMLIELNNQLSQESVFSNELALIRNELIEDFDAIYFLHSKDSVLNELQRIVGDSLVSKEEQSSINEIIRSIKYGNEPLIKFNAEFSDISNNLSDENDVVFNYRGSAFMTIDNEEVNNEFELSFELVGNTVQEAGRLGLTQGYPFQYYITGGEKRNDTLEFEMVAVSDARMSTIENALANDERYTVSFLISGNSLKYIGDRKGCANCPSGLILKKYDPAETESLRFLKP